MALFYNKEHKNEWLTICTITLAAAFSVIIFQTEHDPLVVSLPSVKVINDYKMLLLACWSCQLFLILYYFKHLFPLETSSLSQLHSSFPVVSLCHPGYCISFCCSYFGGSLVGNVLLLVSDLCNLHFCKLLVVHFLTSNFRGLVWHVQFVSCSVWPHIAYSNFMYFPILRCVV